MFGIGELVCEGSVVFIFVVYVCELIVIICVGWDDVRCCKFFGLFYVILVEYKDLFWCFFG